VKRFARFVGHHPLAVLAVVAAITLFALHGIVDLRTGTPRLGVDPGMDELLPEGDEARIFYEEARQIFGADESVLLVLEAENVFSPEPLAALQRITRRLERERVVQRVLSLANATSIEGRDDDIYVGPYYEDVPRDLAELERLRREVDAHPLYGGSLVSRDARATALVVYLDHVSDRELLEHGLSDRLAEVAREEAGGLPIRVTGSPHVKLRLSQAITSELKWVLPAVLGLAALLCALSFRTLRGVMLPLASIALALIWTLGAMGWSGSPINIVSNMVPPLIITLGFASAMHVVSEYYELQAHVAATDRESNRAAVQRVLEEMGLAIAVNGFTTVLGFLSLCVTNVVAIREFGLWAVVGVVASTITSLTFIPALLVVLDPGRRRPARSAGSSWIDRLAEGIARFDVRNRRGILAAGLAVLAVSLAGMLGLRVSDGFIDTFAPGSEVRTSFEAVNEKLGGVSTFYVVVDGGEQDAFRRPENLVALRELQEWLAAQPEIGGTASLADGVMLLNRAFQGGDPAAFAIPERERLLKQLLLVGGDEVTRGFVDGSFRKANIAVRARVDATEEVAGLLARIEERVAELPQRLRAQVTGDIVLLQRTMDAISRGQLQSIATAIFTIYLTLAFLLTSFRVGLYALLPNLLPMAIYYGTLGLLDVPLNTTMSLIGVITLGIAVDDTVHYFARFGLEARRIGEEQRATATTLRSVIRPITATTIGLCLGFLTFAFSDLRSHVQFGLLSAFTIAVAWVLELTLSPAICSRIRLVTLWDLLAIDLGPNPQRSIPLFEGLTERQARVFALMSQVMEVPAGTRLVSEGDKGDDMFVVIDGELVASLGRFREPAGARVEFSRMRRGDTVGEIALFSKARTADVDVVRDARLLRFGEKELERLRRRYPKIAAVVYRNLGHVLASRVVTTTQALR
jgi:predicted RND superfamily exporter protein